MSIGDNSLLGDDRWAGLFGIDAEFVAIDDVKVAKSSSYPFDSLLRQSLIDYYVFKNKMKESIYLHALRLGTLQYIVRGSCLCPHTTSLGQKNYKIPNLTSQNMFFYFVL